MIRISADLCAIFIVPDGGKISTQMEIIYIKWEAGIDVILISDGTRISQNNAGYLMYSAVKEIAQ